MVWLGHSRCFTQLGARRIFIDPALGPKAAPASFAGKALAGPPPVFGGFDPAILDCGQYDKVWPYLHMNSAEAAQAAVDLRAQALLPVHAGRFAIAHHPWDEPLTRSVEAKRGKPYRLVTPTMGEPVFLDGREQAFSLR